MDLALVCRLEAAALRGWPATVQRAAPGGWVLRATPGLDRARSNHALTPCRPLTARELDPSLAMVEAFAHEHAIRTGIQVSPLALHGRLEHELDARGWESRWPVLVLTGAAGRRASRAADPPELVITDRADRAWLQTWGRCETERDVDAHAATVLAALQGRARFVRVGSDAVAIGVPWESMLGIFCLAVDLTRRRAGLGRLLVSALLDSVPGVATAYLQVEEENKVACAFYERLGFSEAYRYRHRLAPGS